MATRPKKLLDRVRDVIRSGHYSIRNPGKLAVHSPLA